MKKTALAALLACLGAAPLNAQAPPPRDDRGGPEGRRPDGPPPNDRAFLYGQAMRAIDEKTSILLEQGKTDLAIDELKKVYGFDVPPRHPIYEAKAHLIGRLAITYAGAGKKKEAVETIQRLLSDVPAGTVAEATAWVEAGSVYKQLGMSDEALKAFDRAIDLSQKLAASGRPPARPGPPPPR